MKVQMPKLDTFRKFVADCGAVVFFAGEMEAESTENFDRRSAELNPNVGFFIEAACEMGRTCHFRDSDRHRESLREAGGNLSGKTETGCGFRG